MFDNKAPTGGYKPLLAEALPTNTSAVNVFNNAPQGTIGLSLSIFTGTLTIEYMGTTPVASTTGHDLGTGTYDITMAMDLLKQVKGIGGATGYVTYFGVG